jgi:hypothetical protein
MQTQFIFRFWTAARAMFARMRAALAGAIAAHGPLSLDQKHAVRTWLAPLETLARKIALIHALALIAGGDARPQLATRPMPCAATPPRRYTRAPSLRLWPREAPLAPGRNAAQLARVRALRRSDCERLARRIDALARMLARPLPAARRLARALRTKPHLALKLALTPTPRTPLYPESEYAQAGARAFEDAYAFSVTLCDTS